MAPDEVQDRLGELGSADDQVGQEHLVLVVDQLGAVDPTTVGNLEGLPLTLEEWSGRNEPPFDDSVLAVLQPDSYINRIYSDQGALAAVYIGYHRTQSQGKSIHSPLNCLPGSGWQPIRTDRVPLHTRGMANRVVIQHGEDRHHEHQRDPDGYPCSGPQPHPGKPNCLIRKHSAF